MEGRGSQGRQDSFWVRREPGTTKDPTHAQTHVASLLTGFKETRGRDEQGVSHKAALPVVMWMEAVTRRLGLQSYHEAKSQYPSHLFGGWQGA